MPPQGRPSARARGLRSIALPLLNDLRGDHAYLSCGVRRTLDQQFEASSRLISSLV